MNIFSWLTVSYFAIALRSISRSENLNRYVMDQMRKVTKAGAETRRGFIKKTAAAAAMAATMNPFKAPVYGQNQAPSTGRVIGANDRIVVAFVGAGGMGFTHVRNMKTSQKDNNLAFGGICDVYKKYADRAKEHLGLTDADVYADYRKMLEKKEIDAVVVATVDHWHAPISIDAVNAGKHVYVQKPMTRHLDEAFALYDAVKKTGKTFQVGSQGCSDGKYHKVAELIKAGKIGKLVWAEGCYCRNAEPNGEWNYAIPNATPEEINWDAWLGHAGAGDPKLTGVPAKSNWKTCLDHFARWRRYHPYCSGLLGDLVPHRLHPMMLATGNPEFPKRVVCTGTRKISTNRDVNDTTHIVAEFPSGLSLFVVSTTVNERGIVDTIHGAKGSLIFGGISSHRVELAVERWASDEIDSETFDGLQPGEANEIHEKNWFDSIRTNKLPNGNIELGIRVQTVISLAEMSDRLGQTLFFDEKTRKITNGDGKEFKPITYGTLKSGPAWG
jgi:predicted dehydrogenase